jgi:hypothetical protein
LEEGLDRSDDDENQRQPVDRVDGEIGREDQPVSHRVAFMTQQGQAGSESVLGDSKRLRRHFRVSPPLLRRLQLYILTMSDTMDRFSGSGRNGRPDRI